jgi:branched-chain amino acid aminotransferase
MKTYIWHNGEFKTDDTPIITANDRLRFGEGVFRTILVINGSLQFADDHLNALQKAAHVFWPAYRVPAFNALTLPAQELLQKNNCATGTAMVNIFITGGIAQHGFATNQNQNAETFIRAQAWTALNTHVHAIIAQSIRRNEQSPLSNIKYCGGYAEQIIALREAHENGGNEAIFLNTAGYVCCSSVAAIIMIKDGKLITPPLSDGPQNSATRARLIAKHGARERSIKPEELFECEGIYLVNSLRGAVPISTLNGQPIARPALDLSQIHLDPNA